jgi:hypothetical protein
MVTRSPCTPCPPEFRLHCSSCPQSETDWNKGGCWEPWEIVSFLAFPSLLLLYAQYECVYLPNFWLIPDAPDVCNSVKRSWLKIIPSLLDYPAVILRPNDSDMFLQVSLQDYTNLLKTYVRSGAVRNETRRWTSSNKLSGFRSEPKVRVPNAWIHHLGRASTLRKQKDLLKSVCSCRMFVWCLQKIYGHVNMGHRFVGSFCRCNLAKCSMTEKGKKWRKQLRLLLAWGCIHV